MAVLKKLQPLITELKTVSLAQRLEKLRETQEGESCRPSHWLTSVQGGSMWATCVSCKVLLLHSAPKARRTTLVLHPNRKQRERVLWGVRFGLAMLTNYNATTCSLQKGMVF